MSDPLRIALVAEGPTDRIVINAALRSMLGGRAFVLKQIFPEGSVVFGEMGSGWVGVLRWCRSSAARGKGALSNDKLIFEHFDLLIIHLDADVAGFSYQDGAITKQADELDLPCVRPCPPVSDTTNVLRHVLLSWCGENVLPARTVLCVPSKSTEAWVVAALYPHDFAMRQGIECFAGPEIRLGQQPKRLRIRKAERDYKSKADELERSWLTLIASGALTQGLRFQEEFLGAVAMEDARQQTQRVGT